MAEDPTGHGAVSIRGYTELRRTLGLYGKEIDKALRKDLRSLAKPVQQKAESLMRTNVRNIGSSWWKAKVGVSKSLVYVAPVKKGVKKGEFKRRSFADIAIPLYEEALEGQGDQIAAEITESVNRVGDRLGLT